MKAATKKEISIDATGQTMGRIASKAAYYLMGKHRPDYDRAKFLGDKVHIVNISKLKIIPRKLKWKIYYRYTGFIGGLKEETLGSLWLRRPEEAVRRAVKGMLPKNRLKAKRLVSLKITL